MKSMQLLKALIVTVPHHAAHHKEFGTHHQTNIENQHAIDQRYSDEHATNQHATDQHASDEQHATDQHPLTLYFNEF